MSDTKFTPGPWVANFDDVLSSDDPQDVVCTCVPPLGYGYDVVQANAHLIAASPDLYEMCQYLLDIFNHETKSVTALDSEKIENLLSKARGES